MRFFFQPMTKHISKFIQRKPTRKELADVLRECRNKYGAARARAFLSQCLYVGCYPAILPIEREGNRYRKSDVFPLSLLEHAGKQIAYADVETAIWFQSDSGYRFQVRRYPREIARILLAMKEQQ